ncbi:MAG TPA: MarR family transcriptional regulator [Bryobacteraceae bacterium]|nr:MarR family transcriptional regulator [Bryobacteraceae bacterium]
MDHSEQMIGELLGSAHVFDAAVDSVMDELLSRAIDNQLTPLQLKILRLLHLTDASSVADVAAFLGVSNAAASKSVDRLVRRKFLRRVEARQDRRTSDLTLTTSGETILGQYERAKFRKLKKVFRGFAPAELRHAAELLERMAKAIVTQSANLTDVCLQCGIHLKERCLVREAARAECAYQSRRNKREVRGHGTKIETAEGGGAGMGPPD